MRGLGQGQRQERLPMLRARGRGVKPGMTNGVNALGWGVPQDARDELVCAQPQALALGIAMVCVVEADAAIVQRQRAILG